MDGMGWYGMDNVPYATGRDFIKKCFQHQFLYFHRKSIFLSFFCFGGWGYSSDTHFVNFQINSLFVFLAIFFWLTKKSNLVKKKRQQQSNYNNITSNKHENDNQYQNKTEIETTKMKTDEENAVTITEIRQTNKSPIN